jgi:hypothetical protein
VGSTRCSTGDDYWIHYNVHRRYDIKCVDGIDRMAGLLSTSMPDLWMPQMVLGIHARIRAVIRNAAANQAMHLSREMRRFEMEDLSSRRGDRER